MINLAAGGPGQGVQGGRRQRRGGPKPRKSGSGRRVGPKFRAFFSLWPQPAATTPREDFPREKKRKWEREMENKSEILGCPGQGVRGWGSVAWFPGREVGAPRGVGDQLAWNLLMPKVEQLQVNKLMR